MWVFLRCPAQFLRGSIRKVNLVFEPHAQTNGKVASFVFVFSRQVMTVFVFFRIVVSVISLERTTIKRRVFRLLVGAWSTRCKKNHIPICNIGRGIAKQQHSQHLGWPSSYLYTPNKKKVWTVSWRPSRCVRVNGFWEKNEFFFVVLLNRKNITENRFKSASPDTFFFFLRPGTE